MIDGMENSQAARGKVALFIDVDNVLILAQKSGLPFQLSLIIDRVRQQGIIMSSKAYADWTANFLRPFLGDFRANAIELVQLLTSSSSREHKNTADIQLTVDAMEMVFSPVRPDIVVIVGGDRDYVPLVQKLKRYGIFVVGIGVEAGVSNVLIQACDSFVFYDYLVPQAQEEIAETLPLPDTSDAHILMRRAVEALQGEGRAATGASVHLMMKQLDPAFDLARYKTTMKALAAEAERAGHVLLTENEGSDFTLSAPSSSSAPAMPPPEVPQRQYDFSTEASMTVSYWTMLQDRRIPLLPWRIREKFINLLWDGMKGRGESGMSIDTMRTVLVNHTHQFDLSVSVPMIQKLLYTLNFARCFSASNGAKTGYRFTLPEELDLPLHPVVGVKDAIDKLHEQYLRILSEQAPVLHPRAVFELLYGDDITDDQERRERIDALTVMCNRIKPLGAIGRALLNATSL